jgi:3-oxoacyl-[acyl-carrier-protein] synthase II
MHMPHRSFSDTTCSNVDIESLDFRTPIGDRIERQAIEQLLSNVTDEHVLVSSTKGHTGHLLAGAGALETVFTLLACHHGRCPSTLNYEKNDEDLDRSLSMTIVDTQRALPWTTSKRVALKNSFGFGGTNACLVVSNLF